MYEQLDFLEYIYGIPMDEAEFMMNENHEIQYNSVCMECRNECKQSYKCLIVECPLFAGKRRKSRHKV